MTLLGLSLVTEENEKAKTGGLGALHVSKV
jgi:hypothetical protein